MEWLFKNYNAFILRIRVNPDKLNTWLGTNSNIGNISVNTVDLLLWPTYGNIVTMYYNLKTHTIGDSYSEYSTKIQFYDFNPDVTIRDIDVNMSYTDTISMTVKMYDLSNNLISYCVHGDAPYGYTRYMWKQDRLSGGYFDNNGTNVICSSSNPLALNYDSLCPSDYGDINWKAGNTDSNNTNYFSTTNSLPINKIFITTKSSDHGDLSLFNTLNSAGIIEQKHLIWNSGIASETQTKTVAINSGMKTIYQAGNDVSLVGDNTAITDKSISGGTKNSIYGSVKIPT